MVTLGCCALAFIAVLALIAVIICPRMRAAEKKAAEERFERRWKKMLGKT